MSRRIRGVSFDLWFTLIWSDDDILDEYTNARINALYNVISKYNTKVSVEDVEKIYSYTAHFRMIINPRKLIKYILYAVGLDPSEEVIEEAFNAYDRATYKVKPFINDEAIYTLEKLHKDGFTVGIISNTSFSTNSIWRMLENIGISEYIDIVISSANEEVKKPFPEIFYRFLSKAGLKPYEVVHVGDKYMDDVIGAYNVGMHAVLYRGLWDKYRIYREFRNEKLLNVCPRECYVINDLRGVFKVIEKLKA